MKAIGITSGIGSMLIGARTAGFNIEGNVEWRKYYHYRDQKGRNTFEENFPGAIFKKTLEELTDEEIERLSNADIALGHPECGNYSNLSNSSGNLQVRLTQPGDIPLFIELVKKFKPRFFVQDNLPKSLMGVPMSYWAEHLPEYDLFPEWISNWGYGNIQKFRKRFFMIGALKEEKFVFIPNEYDHTGTVRKIFQAIRPDAPNNESHTREGMTSSGRGLIHENALSWSEFANYALKNLREGEMMPYYKNGEMKKHIGMVRGYKDKHSHVLTGGGSFTISSFTGLPYTIRERAAIQGCPDNFKFYGTIINPDGTYSYRKNNAMIKQTAKFMPVQFCEYVSKLIALHIKGQKEFWKPNRIAKPNDLITEAKKFYCEKVGYTNQDRACDNCWVGGC